MTREEQLRAFLRGEDVRTTKGRPWGRSCEPAARKELAELERRTENVEEPRAYGCVAYVACEPGVECLDVAACVRVGGCVRAQTASRQRLVWLPVQPDGPAYGRGPLILQASGEQPASLWTLIGERSSTKPPALPYSPQHGHNAFLEDRGHDWTWLHGSRIRYSGTCRERGGVWLLLEAKP